MFYLYVITSDTGKIYIGQTDNIDRRLNQHNDKAFDKKSYTKKQGSNWKLVYSESYNTRVEVLKRERIIKSHKGRDWLNKILNGRVAQR